MVKLCMIEINDEIIEKLKKAWEKSGYDLPETDEGWNKVIEDMLNEKITEDFGDVLADEPKEHNCRDNIELNGEHVYLKDTVVFFGECKVCGNKLVETFAYQDTRERKSDKVIDECEKTLIEASVWRKMNANTIIASIMAGLAVLRDIGFGEDDHQKRQLHVLMDMIVNMLLRDKET